MAEKLARSFRQEKEKKLLEEPPILKFIRIHIRNLFHFPLATMLKGAVVLTEELVIEAMPAAWELLLETNHDTATSSAAVFLMGSVKAQNFAFDIMQRALKNKNPDIRIGAIQRYLVLWKCRFHVWPRMEDNAHDATFKVPPGGIEFTLPSPKIGIESLPVVDPPWMPVQQTKDMDMTLNQDRHVSVGSAESKIIPNLIIVISLSPHSDLWSPPPRAARCSRRRRYAMRCASKGISSGQSGTAS